MEGGHIRLAVKSVIVCLHSLLDVVVWCVGWNRARWKAMKVHQRMGESVNSPVSCKLKYEC